MYLQYVKHKSTSLLRCIGDITMDTDWGLLVKSKSDVSFFSFKLEILFGKSIVMKTTLILSLGLLVIQKNIKIRNEYFNLTNYFPKEFQELQHRN